MTSLSEQLKRLAVAQTSRLQSDKKRASLLFSSEEAAKLDRETIFGIGNPSKSHIYRLQLFIQACFRYQWIRRVSTAKQQIC